MIIYKAKHLKSYFIYCNLVGAQDELIFDGESIGVSEDGKLIALGNKFSEDIIYIDSEKDTGLPMPKIDKYSEVYNALVLGVKDYFDKTHHTEAVIGLSGGIDSSLVACIALPLGIK